MLASSGILRKHRLIKEFSLFLVKNALYNARKHQNKKARGMGQMTFTEAERASRG